MGGGNINDVVGCDDGAGGGTDECGVNRAVVGLVEGLNVGYVEKYCRGEWGGWDNSEDDACSDGLMDGVDVGDESGGVGGSSDCEGLGNLGGMFIMDMDIFEWQMDVAVASVGKASVGWSYGREVVGGNGVKVRGAVGARAVRQALSVMRKAPFLTGLCGGLVFKPWWRHIQHGGGYTL